MSFFWSQSHTWKLKVSSDFGCWEDQGKALSSVVVAYIYTSKDVISIFQSLYIDIFILFSSNAFMVYCQPVQILHKSSGMDRWKW